MIRHIALLLLAGVATAQTAKVVALSPADAKEAADLHAQKAAIEAKMWSLESRIRRKLYPPWATCIPGQTCFPMYSLPPPWSCGFEYSEDFKYVVPKACPPADKNGFPLIVH